MLWRFIFSVTLGSALTMGAVSPAFAQEGADSPDIACLRYLQIYERGNRIPSGLLTAIALVESGRPNAQGQLMAWPWTVNVAGRGQFFETKEAAVAEVRKQLDAGQRSVDVGCMQINLRYHPDAFPTIDDAFDPAKNVAYGAEFLASLHQVQGSWSAAVERYHSSDDGRREEYRERVIAAWNNEARTIVMNAVLAEDTDTPYHRAVRDFVEGRYADALDKYQAIVDSNPKDRIGLLGVAMSFEELGREPEAMQAYAQYLAAEPNNESILSKLILRATSKEPAAARADLEAVLKAGVINPDLYAVLAQVTSASGDNAAALTYATDALRSAPNVAGNYLNAGVIADKLNQPTTAVRYYEQFLSLFDRQPLLIDAPAASVRERVRFLRTKI